MKKVILVGIVAILLAVVGGGVYVILNAGDLTNRLLKSLAPRRQKPRSR